jgi:hypothetical protein
MRLVTAAALVVAALVGLAKLPHDLQAARPLTVSLGERRLAPLNYVDLAPELFATAARLVPRNATYGVIVGDRAPVSTPLTKEAVASLAAFWLLPRRQAPNAQTASWILSFGGDLGSLHLRYARIVHVSTGVDIAEVKR